MAEQPQLVPKDFTTDEYNKLKEAWAASPKGQALIKSGSEQDAWYYETGGWQYVFEADVYGNLPNQKGNFQTSFEMAEGGSAAPHIFLAQFQGATELQELITEDESGLTNNNNNKKKRLNLTQAGAGNIPAAGVTASGTGQSLRYPSNQGGITDDHDYVTFQFYKYAPPFRKRTRTLSQGQTGSGNIVAEQYDYNQATGKEENLYTNSNGMYPIVLYMPEDISTGFRSNWTGKAYGNFASNALKAAGVEGLGNKLKGAFKTATEQADNIIPLAGAAALRKLMQKVGGDQITNDDLFGGISGASLNQNVG